MVIPTLNEAARLPALLAALGVGGWGAVVVADGGSTDGTTEIAAGWPDVALRRSASGRGRQMNAGVEATAKADALLFLHADTRLPPDASILIAAALSRPDTVGGAFRVTFDLQHPLLRLSGACSRIDSGWTTFGDGAFFMRRTAFDAVGGFPEQPLLEDVEMRRRLRRIGRFVKLGAAVTTSARRFEAVGPLRRQLKNGLTLGLHALGVGPKRLARLYR